MEEKNIKNAFETFSEKVGNALDEADKQLEKTVECCKCMTEEAAEAPAEEAPAADAAPAEEAAAEEAPAEEAAAGEAAAEEAVVEEAPAEEAAAGEEKKADNRFVRKTQKGFEVDTTELEASFKNLGEKIAAALNSATQALNVARETAAQKASQKKKADKLAKMLPYMKEDEIHEIAERVIAGDEDFKDIELSALLPFMSEADCRVLFEKSLIANDETPGADDTYLQCVPFVGEEALTKLVDRYVEGSYQDIKMDSVYPYLSSKDVKRIFYYEMKKQ